jgi:ankyrin repeat domain-containing protein 50
VEEHQQMGALLMSVEKITYLTNRCTVYEILYGSRTPGQVLHNLHAALVVLYATILRLIALANRLFVKNTATRAIHALINPGEVSDFLAKCQDLETRVEIEAQNCERMRSQEVDANLQTSIGSLQKLLEDLQKPILRTDERVSTFLEKVDQRERLEILEWVSDVQYGMHHETVKEQRTQSTCEWLLRHKRYLEWQDTSSSIILWLHGTRRFSTSIYVE